MEKLDQFISWLVEFGYRIEVYRGETDVVILVYSGDKALSDDIPAEHREALSIEFHYAEVIVKSDGEHYFPTVHEYDPAVEFITVRVTPK